jgi:hypothetical protein
MKLFLSLLFVILVLMPKAALAQEVLNAKSEDIAEFDKMLDKNHTKNQRPPPNNPNESARTGFNQSAPNSPNGNGPDAPPPPPSFGAPGISGSHPPGLNGGPPPPPRPSGH